MAILRCASGRGRVGQQAGFSDLQVVVFGEIEHKLPGHGLVRFELAVDHHAFDAAHGGRNAPGGVAQVAAGAAATGTELAHHTRQPLGPIAGSEGSAIVGDALDKDFFGSAGDHRIEAVKRTPRPPGSPWPRTASIVSYIRLEAAPFPHPMAGDRRDFCL